MHLYPTYIHGPHPPYRLGIDNQSASASHARECLRHRHVGGSCLLGESSSGYRCSYCPYLSAFKHSSRYVHAHSDAHELNTHILTPSSRASHLTSDQVCLFLGSTHDSWLARGQQKDKTSTHCKDGDEKQPAMGRF